MITYKKKPTLIIIVKKIPITNSLYMVKQIMLRSRATNRKQNTHKYTFKKRYLNRSKPS